MKGIARVVLIIWCNILQMFADTDVEKNSFTYAQTEKHFNIMSEKITGISEKYDCKIEVNEDDSEIFLRRNEDVLSVKIVNTAPNANEKGKEYVNICYTRNNKGDKKFDLDMLLELVNSVSDRTYSKQECDSFLNEIYKYRKKCWTERGEVEKREWSMDFFGDYYMWYERCIENEFSDMYEELEIQTLSNN